MAKKPTKYTVTDGELVLVLERDEEDPKWFVVTSPFNPDVVTQARTIEEAFEMARDLIALLEEVRTEERAANGKVKTTPRRKKTTAG